MDNNKPTKELGFEISKEVAAGNYSNLAIITHSGSEFFIDFAKVMPAMPKASIATRVIMTPEHAKRLFLALRDNLSKYESQFGEIKLHNNTPKGTIPMGFGPNTAEA